MWLSVYLSICLSYATTIMYGMYSYLECTVKCCIISTSTLQFLEPWPLCLNIMKSPLRTNLATYCDDARHTGSKVTDRSLIPLYMVFMWLRIKVIKTGLQIRPHFDFSGRGFGVIIERDWY